MKKHEYHFTTKSSTNQLGVIRVLSANNLLDRYTSIIPPDNCSTIFYVYTKPMNSWQCFKMEILIGIEILKSKRELRDLLDLEVYKKVLIKKKPK